MYIYHIVFIYVLDVEQLILYLGYCEECCKQHRSASICSFLFYGEYISKSAITVLYGRLILNFFQKSLVFFLMAVLIYVQTNSVQAFSLHLYQRSFSFGKNFCNRSDLIAHRYFLLPSSDNNWHWAFFNISLGHVFSWKIFKIFAHSYLFFVV